MINERFIRIAVWVLAVFLPGGLAVLALWAGVRAVRARMQASAQSAQAPVLPMPADAVRT